MASLLWWVGLPAGAQDGGGLDVFEAHETPKQALQRMQQKKKAPLRRGKDDVPVVPYLPDDSLRTRSLTGTSGVLFTFPEGPGGGKDSDGETQKADKGDRHDKDHGKDRDDDRDKDRDDDRDDDDDDG